MHALCCVWFAMFLTTLMVVCSGILKRSIEVESVTKDERTCSKVASYLTCVEVVFLDIRRRRARKCTWSDIDMEIGDKERCGTFSAFGGTRRHDGGSDGDDFPGHVLVHDDF